MWCDAIAYGMQYAVACVRSSSSFTNIYIHSYQNESNDSYFDSLHIRLSAEHQSGMYYIVCKYFIVF